MRVYKYEPVIINGMAYVIVQARALTEVLVAHLVARIAVL